jgi:hypothetical protein
MWKPTSFLPMTLSSRYLPGPLAGCVLIVLEVTWMLNTGTIMYQHRQHQAPNRALDRVAAQHDFFRTPQ